MKTWAERAREELGRLAAWLIKLADQADREADSFKGRFEALREATIKDAKNLRATAKSAQALVREFDEQPSAADADVPRGTSGFPAISKNGVPVNLGMNVLAPVDGVSNERYGLGVGCGFVKMWLDEDRDNTVRGTVRTGDGEEFDVDVNEVVVQEPGHAGSIREWLSGGFVKVADTPTATFTFERSFERHPPEAIFGVPAYWARLIMIGMLHQLRGVTSQSIVAENLGVFAGSGVSIGPDETETDIDALIERVRKQRNIVRNALMEDDPEDISVSLPMTDVDAMLDALRSARA